MQHSPLSSRSLLSFFFSKTSAQLILAVLIFSVLGDLQGQSELPHWNKRDAERFEEPGSVMLGNGLWPLNTDGSSTRPEQDPELEALKEKIRGGDRILASDHIRPRFPLSIIDPIANGRSLRPPPLNVRPTPLYLSQTESIPDEYRSAYFENKKPTEHLIDPQNFLTKKDSEEITQLLLDHQAASPLDIYLMILGPSQALPESVSLSSLHNRWFGQKPAAIVVYHMQAPQKTRFEFGDKIHASLPATAIDRATYSCIREAQSTSNPVDQIKRLALEMSIRLFWMTSVVEGKRPVSNPIAEEALSSEASPGIGDQAKSFFAVIWPTLKIIFYWFGALTLLAFIAYSIWIWRRDAITGRPIRFPERDLPMRLGGSHAGGAYIGMTFTPSSASPKKQA